MDERVLAEEKIEVANISQQLFMEITEVLYIISVSLSTSLSVYNFCYQTYKQYKIT